MSAVIFHAKSICPPLLRGFNITPFLFVFHFTCQTSGSETYFPQVYFACLIQNFEFISYQITCLILLCRIFFMWCTHLHFFALQGAQLIKMTNESWSNCLDEELYTGILLDCSTTISYLTSRKRRILSWFWCRGRTLFVVSSGWSGGNSMRDPFCSSVSLPVYVLLFFSSSIHVTNDKVQCLCPYIDLCSVWSGWDWEDGAHAHTYAHSDAHARCWDIWVPLEMSACLRHEISSAWLKMLL